MQYATGCQEWPESTQATLIMLRFYLVYFIFVVMGDGTQASGMLGKHSTTEPTPSSPLSFRKVSE
jgi:hypothetical protein